MTTAARHPEADSKISVEHWLRMYRQMVSIRLFEEQVNELYTRALMPGLAHLYSGEEAEAGGNFNAPSRRRNDTSRHGVDRTSNAKRAIPLRLRGLLIGEDPRTDRGK